MQGLRVQVVLGVKIFLLYLCMNSGYKINFVKIRIK